MFQEIQECWNLKSEAGKDSRVKTEYVFKKNKQQKFEQINRNNPNQITEGMRIRIFTISLQKTVAIKYKHNQSKEEIRKQDRDKVCRNSDQKFAQLG